MMDWQRRSAKSYVRNRLLSYIESLDRLPNPIRYVGLPGEGALFERELLQRGFPVEQLVLFERDKKLFNKVLESLDDSFKSVDTVLTEGDILSALTSTIGKSNFVYLDLCSFLTPQVLGVITNVFEQLPLGGVFGVTIMAARERSGILFPDAEKDIGGQLRPRQQARIRIVLHHMGLRLDSLKFKGQIFSYADKAPMLTFFGRKVIARKHSYSYVEIK